MIITHHLSEPCPHCGQSSNYGNVSVAQSILQRGCSACGNWERIPLPRLKKKIIYLDQFFLSHAFREQQKDFVEAAKRLRSLANKQLVVCPWSTIHEFETYLWRHSSQSNLLEFIKQSARGRKYLNSHHIKSMQIKRAFRSFVNNRAIQMIDSLDAFHSDIHEWDDYFWIDVGYFVNDTERIRIGKEQAVSSLVDLFNEWETSSNSYEQDFVEESNDYARSLIQLHIQSVQEFMQGSVLKYLNTPADVDLVEALMRQDSDSLNFEERLKRLESFLYSDNFKQVPYVDISCRLFAVLRKRVREGQFANREKAKRNLSGLFYDIDAISIYGPYSDAIFIDRSMHQWLVQEEACIIENYSFKIYSAETWSDFHSYLDEIESNCPIDVRKMLPIVYPGIEERT